MTTSRSLAVIGFAIGLFLSALGGLATGQTSSVLSLDGDNWQLATDPQNVGREQQWFQAPHPEAKPTRVPWVIQDVFPEYHGVAWYWRDFNAPTNPHSKGRYLLRFNAVDYLAEVWMNGQRVGGHEGDETPFELDVTDALRPGAKNLLAVRVLNPTHEPIDGVALRLSPLGSSPTGSKECPIKGDTVYNAGGIVDSVALVVAPAIRFENLLVQSDWKSGEVHIRAGMFSMESARTASVVTIKIADARSGKAMVAKEYPQNIDSGRSTLEMKLIVPQHELWDPTNPSLYKLAAEIGPIGNISIDTRSVRFGFRDFRFENGYFRLNGKRVYLKGAAYCPHYPVGYTVPMDEGLLRKDVMLMKAVGHNFCRIAFGGSLARHLDIFDELGVMVQQGHRAELPLNDTPRLGEHWNRSISEVILRDFNHPSIIIWALLNESGNNMALHHAAKSIPFLRKLDSSRLLMFNSGRFDGVLNIGSFSNPGSEVWDVGVAQLLDLHCYPPVPLSSDTLNTFRTGDRPASVSANPGYNSLTPEDAKNSALFISENGQSGPVDLPATLAGFARIGKAECDEARYFRGLYGKFMADWQGWRLSDTWSRPEDYFAAGHRTLAALRKTGETAIRANPRVVSYCSTHLIADLWYSGSGISTLFRKLKPDVSESMLLASAPLRWCLLTEPQSIYRGGRIRLDASLANEDVLPPGEYPASIQVVGPNNEPVFDKKVSVRVPEKANGKEPPFAQAILIEDLVIDGPAGEYRFLAKLERGDELKGGSTRFQVTDAANMPAMPAEVVLWGEDPTLGTWLSEHAVKVLPLNAENMSKRRVILASAKASAPGGATAFRELARHIARGSILVSLTPTVFAEAKDTTRWLPLAQKGAMTTADTIGGYYHADRWAKKHAIFEGLPAGGMMDNLIYRNVITNDVLGGCGLPDEAICGAIRTNCGYNSGLHVGVWKFGQGRFIVNTLRIHENLGTDPAAERLLRNLLNYASRNTDKPAAELPADFEAQLKAMGY